VPAGVDVDVARPSLRIPRGFFKPRHWTMPSAVLVIRP
jgi:hypothetical protein